jgi:zinc protease
VKKAEDLDYVRREILAAVERFKTELVQKAKLDAVKNRERYGLALSMTDSDRVAGTVAQFVALKRTPDTIDKLYAIYAKLTPEDLRAIARKYLIDTNRTIVTLTGPAKEAAK